MKMFILCVRTFFSLDVSFQSISIPFEMKMANKFVSIGETQKIGHFFGLLKFFFYAAQFLSNMTLGLEKQIRRKNIFIVHHFNSLLISANIHSFLSDQFEQRTQIWTKADNQFGKCKQSCHWYEAIKHGRKINLVCLIRTSHSIV